MALFKSEKLSFQQTVLQHQNRYYAVISAALGFHLDGSEDFLNESDLLRLFAEYAEQEMMLDEGYKKTKAEVMLLGKVPQPRAQGYYDINMQIGSIDKSIRVFAPRKWQALGLGQFGIVWDEQTLNKPLGLNLQNAFGGNGHRLNPKGKGFFKISETLKNREAFMEPLPAFEVLAPGIKSPHEENIPLAGFSPQAMQSPFRWHYFQEKELYWQTQGFPILPYDFNFNFFQQALPDQQRQAFFQAGETYKITIEDTILQGSLPKIRVRLLLGNKAFENNFMPPIEQPMEFDTLFLIPEQQIGVLIAHASFQVQNINMNEWKHSLVLLENTEQPYSFTECEAIFVDYLKNAALLMPYDSRLRPEQNLNLLAKKEESDREFSKVESWIAKIKPDSFKNEPKLRIKGNAKTLLDSKPLQLNGYDFKNIALTEQQFSSGFFENCAFENIDFTNSIFQGMTFVDCTFSNCLYYQAQFDSAEFNHCKWIDCDMRYSQINCCRFVNSSIKISRFDFTKFSHSYLINTLINSSSLQETHWDAMQIKEGIWKNINARAAQFNSLRAQRIKITDSDFSKTVGNNSMMNGQGMALIRVNFTAANWNGCNFMESYWYKACLEESIFQNTEWSAAKILRSSLFRTDFSYSQFADSYFLASPFLSSKVKSALFAGARLKGSPFDEQTDIKMTDLKHALIRSM